MHGVILQTPLPEAAKLEDLASAITPEKDIDGANPLSLGRLAASLPAFAPATAEAVLAVAVATTSATPDSATVTSSAADTSRPPPPRPRITVLDRHIFDLDLASTVGVDQLQVTDHLAIAQGHQDPSGAEIRLELGWGNPPQS